MAIIKKCKSIVEKIENPLSDVYIVSFRSKERNYRYLPGQFLHLALDPYDPSSQWPESRCFSMQTSDNEELIKITYSVKGVFTRRMASELCVGKEIWLKLPYGELFNKEHNKNKTVFIAGGTGITPYLSLFSSEQFKEYQNPVLYLGIRDENYNLYQMELKNALIVNNSFKVNVINQEIDGILNIEKILEENGADKTFFISGPPLMIKNFKKILQINKVYDIITDDWE